MKLYYNMLCDDGGGLLVEDEDPTEIPLMSAQEMCFWSSCILFLCIPDLEPNT